MDIIQSNYDVYAKYVSMFTGYRVAKLREIAVRMNLSGRSTMKKGELAHALAIAVLSWSEGAFADNDRDKEESLRDLEHPDSNITGMSMDDRIKNYHAQNGSQKLTPRQQRRINHKFNRSVSRAYDMMGA